MKKVILVYFFQCSAHCGAGVRVRHVYCTGECTEADRPRNSEQCRAGRSCSGEWFTGRWSVCSHSCGEGHQTREVLCTLRTENGSSVLENTSSVLEPGGSALEHRVVAEDLCQHRRKPRTSRKCQIQTCKPAWFYTEWSKVSFRDC